MSAVTAQARRVLPYVKTGISRYVWLQVPVSRGTASCAAAPQLEVTGKARMRERETCTVAGSQRNAFHSREGGIHSVRKYVSPRAYGG